MKVEFNFNGMSLTATREPLDRPIYEESTLWYHIKNTLNALGHRFVRQVPAKDGHLTSAPYYLKPGRGSKDKLIIYDEDYMVRNAAKEYREEGQIEFRCYSDE